MSNLRFHILRCEEEGRHAHEASIASCASAKQAPPLCARFYRCANTDGAVVALRVIASRASSRQAPGGHV